MTELQDNTTEMQSKHTASSQTKKAKGSALDRGFPTGIVLIVLVILIIVLQVFSAFKVMNLGSTYFTRCYNHHPARNFSMEGYEPGGRASRY